MNGVAFGVTISLAMSNRFTVEAVEEFYGGVKIACEEYGVTLLGGDTSSSRSGLIISVTVLGKAAPKTIAYRNGSKENDLICVSGDLGAAYAGLQVLEREKSVFLKNPDMQPALDEFSYVVGRQLRPIARVDVVRKLRELKVTPTAMIDVSDGLASDLLHITRESGVGAIIYEEKIPVDHQTNDVADTFKIHPVTFAMNGGEDYELLFTLPLSDYEKIKDLKDIFIIGHIMDAASGTNLMTKSSQVVPITAQGWDHFGGEK
jgi:thiamine-monophosphate kinase